jgi:hypothetical protein
MYLNLTSCQTGCEFAGEYFGAPLYENEGVSAVEEERAYSMVAVVTGRLTTENNQHTIVQQNLHIKVKSC